MKDNIHPLYRIVNVACACGSQFDTRSTSKEPIRIEICSSCHPFFTGKEKLIDTAGRIEKFKKKYAAPSSTEKS
jgi:large subunit ribosomal protein L31